MVFLSTKAIHKNLKNNLKIITIIDPHFADKAPGSRVDDYFKTSLNKLGQISKIAKKRKVDLVLMTGDLFSEKRKERNSHFMTSSLIEMFKSFPCPVATILGNHDLVYNRFEYWPSQPVSNLIKSGSVYLLDQDEFTFSFTKTDKTVRVCGTSYNEDLNIEYLKEPKKDENLLVRVTHSAIEPKAGTYVYGERIWSYKELVDFPPDVFILGHIHNDHGITEIEGKHFFQHGSLMRSSSHDYNLQRDIKVGYLEISPEMSVSTEQIPLEIIPASEVFCLEKKRKIEKELQQMQSFFDQLHKTSEENLAKGSKVSMEDLVASFKDREPSKIHKIIDGYLDKVRV